MLKPISRKNDGVLVVCQNNEDKTVLVYGLNDIAEQLLGYTESEIRGRGLAEILPKKIRDTIEEYLEYEEDATNDLQAVLRRVRDFKLITSEGDELAVACKVVRSDAKDRHHWFRLVIRDEVSQREQEAFRAILRENFKGHEVLDADTGLPDHTSLMKDVEIAHYYAGSKGLEACYAEVRLDGLPALEREFGKKQAQLALKHIAAAIRRNLRADDTIGRLGHGAFGIILIDIAMDSARVVLGRLRGQVSADPLRLAEMSPRKMEISIAFGSIDKDTGSDLPQRCHDALAGEKGTNVILEVV